MLSTGGVTLRTVLKRLGADWLIIGAALVTVVLAIVLLASGPIYADAVTISALRQTLDDAPVTDSNATASVDVPPDLYGETDSLVRAHVGGSLGFVGVEVIAHIEAESFGFDEQPPNERTSLLSFQYFEGIETKTTLVEGEWPGESNRGLTVAVNRPAADALDLAVGDVVATSNRRDESLRVSAVVSGIYEVLDPTDPYWFADDLAVRGVIESEAFNTFGPFVVSMDSMLASLIRHRVHAGWRLIPSYESLEVHEVSRLRTAVSGLDRELNASMTQMVEGDVDPEFNVSTGLPLLLADVDRSLTVTRSSVIALLIQLAILAGYSLILTAGLIVDTRRSETVLMRSRGAAPGRILTLAALEGLLLTVPAVLIGPPLAARMLETLNSVGPLAGIGLTIDPRPTTEAYAIAAFAAALAIFALAFPAWRAARSFGRPSRHRQRQQSRASTQRVGVDLALLVLAVIVFWQIQELGPNLSARVRGRFGVDPLLVLAPALGLLTGALLALRIVPLLARVAEWLARAHSSTVTALASWQVARRPVRYARSSLLLMMAVGIGFFAVSYSTTWTVSQRDQAAFAVGADLSVTPDRSANSLPDLWMSGAHVAVDGVEESMPVLRISGQLGRDSGTTQFIMVDAAKAGDIAAVRADLSPNFESLMGQLVAGRPSPPHVTLPGEPAWLLFEFTANEEIPVAEPASDAPTDNPATLFNATVRVIIMDADGILHRVDAGVIPVNEGTTRLEALLVEPARDELTPVYPLALIGIEIQSQLPPAPSRQVRLDFGGIWTVAPDDSAEPTPVEVDPEMWRVAVTPVIGAQTLPSIAPSTTEGGTLRMEIETGSGFGVAPGVFTLRPSGTGLPDTFPVVVSETFPGTGLGDVGDEISFPPLRINDSAARIVGKMGGFPTVDPGRGEMVLMDLPTYQIMRYEPGFSPPEPDEYWLDTNSDAGEISADLLTGPIQSFSVASRQQVTQSLASDPVALGTTGALSVGFVAAAIFASVGFAVSAIVSARERLVEFALLRALGLSSRQLASWLILEQAALVLVSLALGTLIGGVLTAVILPLVTLTQSGQPVVPEAIVTYPWSTIFGMELAVVAVLGLIVAIMTLLLRRIGLGSLLRLGED